MTSPSLHISLVERVSKYGGHSQISTHNLVQITWTKYVLHLSFHSHKQYFSKFKHSSRDPKNKQSYYKYAILTKRKMIYTWQFVS